MNSVRVRLNVGLKTPTWDEHIFLGLSIIFGVYILIYNFVHTWQSPTKGFRIAGIFTFISLGPFFVRLFFRRITPLQKGELIAKALRVPPVLLTLNIWTLWMSVKFPPHLSGLLFSTMMFFALLSLIVWLLPSKGIKRH